MKPDLAKATRRVDRAEMPPAEKAVHDILDQLADRGLLAEVAARCRRGGVKVEDVAGKGRTKGVVRARHEVWRWMHDELGLSWPEVARVFGRTHDSIIQASDKRESRARRALEDGVAELIAHWLEADALPDEDPRSFIDPVDRARVAQLIRDGAWR